jgi:hypothetical protein
MSVTAWGRLPDYHCAREQEESGSKAWPIIYRENCRRTDCQRTRRALKLRSLCALLSGPGTICSARGK